MEIKRKTWMAFMSAFIAFIGTVAILVACYNRSGTWTACPIDLQEEAEAMDRPATGAFPP